MRALTSSAQALYRLLALTILLTTTTGQQDGLVTVSSNPNYSLLRDCAQNCFYVEWATTTDLIGFSLRCSLSTLKSSKLALNNCYCRPDLQVDAYDIISSCVSKKCPFNENDIATAQFVYDDYCAAHGYRAGAADVPAPTPAAGGSGAAGNGQGGDDGAGSNAAPGAGRTPVQSVPTGGVRSAADTSMLVPGRRLILLAAGMVTAVHGFGIIV